VSCVHECGKIHGVEQIVSTAVAYNGTKNWKYYTIAWTNILFTMQLVQQHAMEGYFRDWVSESVVSRVPGASTVIRLRHITGARLSKMI